MATENNKLVQLTTESPRVVAAAKRLVLFTLLVASLVSCQKNSIQSQESADAVLIGGGIMSATLGSMLGELDQNLTIRVYERLDSLALESSGAWNNAGTGHAAFAELNYTPEAKDGSINIQKAIEISEAFEVSKQYWAYLANKNVLKPSAFIYSVPHLSFVWGKENISFLKKRHEEMTKHPLFFGMEYAEDHAQIKKWAPILMAGRDQHQAVAATRMLGGVDVDFGELTRAMFAGLHESEKFKVETSHEVKDLHRNDDMTWTVVVKDLKTNSTKTIKTKFVFIGAGGGALSLLQKSGVKEAYGFGGFPVGGAWLVTNREDLIGQHEAKVYGKASVGSPPMSVPHLDTRYIDGKKALLFGPFATFSTKFLKNGSWSDLILSVSMSNMVPMMQVGFKNLDLVRYLIGQVSLSDEEQLASVKEYVPNARLEDWRYVPAGQRVQVIKKDKDKGGILQFGTELVSAEDGSIVALLGASPGASTAVKTMLNVLEISFHDQLKSEAWQAKLREMIPSYGRTLAEDSALISAIRERNRVLLELEY